MFEIINIIKPVTIILAPVNNSNKYFTILSENRNATAFNSLNDIYKSSN